MDIAKTYQKNQKKNMLTVLHKPTNRNQSPAHNSLLIANENNLFQLLRKMLETFLLPTHSLCSENTKKNHQQQQQQQRHVQ